MKQKVIISLIVLIANGCSESDKTYREYYDSGVLSLECKIVNDSVKNCIQYLEDGTKRSQSTFVNEELNGQFILFDSSENIIEISNYLGGKLNGKTTLYNPEDSSIEIYTYINDTLNGIYEKRSSNNKVLVEGTYKRGEKEGFFSFYNNGELIEQRQYYLTKQGYLINQQKVFIKGHINKDESYYLEWEKGDVQTHLLVEPYFTDGIKCFLILGDFDNDILSLVPKDTFTIEDNRITLANELIRYDGGMVLEMAEEEIKKKKQLIFKEIFFKF